MKTAKYILKVDVDLRFVLQIRCLPAKYSVGCKSEPSNKLLAQAPG